MRIEVIEEHEDGTPRLATLGEPVQKVAIDLLRSLALGVKNQSCTASSSRSSQPWSKGQVNRPNDFTARSTRAAVRREPSRSRT